MYIETLQLENESLHLELMRREHSKRSILSIKAQEFRPRFRFSIKAKEFVPVSKTVRNILKDELDEGLKKKWKIFSDELKPEMKEKRKELEQLIMDPLNKLIVDPLSVNAKVFVPANCQYRYF